MMNLKQTIAETLLQNSVLNILVNVDNKGVHGMPQTLTGNVVFKLVFETGPQIPDLRLTDFGWSGTLSFSGIQYFVRVPWEACAAFVGDDGKQKYVMQFSDIKTAEQPVEKPVEKPAAKISPLRLIKNDRAG